VDEVVSTCRLLQWKQRDFRHGLIDLRYRGMPIVRQRRTFEAELRARNLKGLRTVKPSSLPIDIRRRTKCAAHHIDQSLVPPIPGEASLQ